MSSKILVASPVFDGMSYCFNRFIESLKSLDYDNFDILVVDNSRKKDFFKELEDIKDIIKIKFNIEEENNKVRIIKSRNRILEYAKENDYDYVLMMDCDVIPPKNLLKSLLNHNKDLVSGLYYNNFVVNGKLKWNPVCWKLLTQEEFNDIKLNLNIPAHLNREDCPRHLTEKEAKSGNLIEVFHPSAGCLLISKSVFSKLSYPILKKTEEIIYGDDVAFIKECRANNFKTWCDTSLVCEHLVEGKFSKDKDGNLIHPIIK